jgi:hypothetical protein
LQPVARWRTTDDKGITWGAFAGAGRAWTVDEAGVVTGWELPKAAAASTAGERLPAANAVYRIDLGMRATPVLSPGGRYMAAVVGGRAMFFDTATGGTVGVVEGVSWPHGNVSFRPDGKQVSVSDQQRINVVDAASGKVERTVPIPQDFAPPAPSVRWLSKTYVLMGAAYLVDLERRRVVWRFDFPGRVRELTTVGGVTYFFQEEFPGRQVRMFSVKLLEHATLAAPTGERPIEELTVFAPGTKVAVVLATDAPADVRERIQKSLEDQVRAMGLVVDPAAPLRITARSENGAAVQQTYSGVGFQQQKVSVTPKIHKVIVERDGKELWATQNTVAGNGLVLVKKGQTIDEAIRAEQAASYAWLASVSLPKDLIGAKAYALRGSSGVEGKAAVPRKK